MKLLLNFAVGLLATLTATVAFVLFFVMAVVIIPYSILDCNDGLRNR